MEDLGAREAPNPPRNPKLPRSLSYEGTKKPTSMTELTPASLPVWLVPAGLLRLRLRQAVALVLYVDGDLGQRLGVLAAMVRTEKQLS